MTTTSLKMPEQAIKLNRQFLEIYSHAASELSLSESAFWIMYALSNPKHSYAQWEICDEWTISWQTVNSAIKCLLEKDYIYLENARAPDRRKKKIRLTRIGKDFVDCRLSLLRHAECDALAAMDKKEQECYLELSQKYISNLRKATKSFVKSKRLTLQSEQEMKK